MTKKIDLKIDEIGQIVKRIQSVLYPGAWLFLHGEMGAGKTTFANALLKALGFDEDVGGSPTFPIMNVYHSRKETNKFEECIHMDLYRVKHANEILMLGLDTMNLKNSIFLVEWSENLTENEWENLFNTIGIVDTPLHLRILYNTETNSRTYVLD